MTSILSTLRDLGRVALSQAATRMNPGSRFVVDYTLLLEEMITAGRFSDSVDDRIVHENFKVEGTGLMPFEYKLLKIGSPISAERLETRLEHGWVWGKIEHLLALRIARLQEIFPCHVMAIGSVIEASGTYLAPAIHGGSSKRKLLLLSAKGQYPASMAFLAIRSRL